MAVHTQLADADFIFILSHYDLGNFISAKAISDGIENSNYFLSTSQGEYVLTVFEEIPADQLKPYLTLLTYCLEHDVKVAAPYLTIDTKSFITLAKFDNKPAIISPKLLGNHPLNPSSEQRLRIGEELAKLHSATQDYTNSFQGIRSLEWVASMACEAALTLQQSSNFLDLIHELQQLDLPQSMTHGDLFPDNCLFVNNELSGMIDFFNAGYSSSLFDLAVLICAWCQTQLHSLDINAVREIITGYSSHRTLTQIEKDNLLLALRIAAIRFYLSRTLFPSTKKPEEFRLLIDHLNSLPTKGLCP